VILLVAAIAPSVAGAGVADAYERKAPYSGPKLTSLTLMCKASHVAAAGFWRNVAAATVHEGARIEQEPQATFWRIAIADAGGTAQIIRFNANLEALEAPAMFSAEPTPGGGLLFVKANREHGTSPETISVDPTNSSFVYSSQHANVLYNRANIWYGSCRPYQ
jgi:hypothetical protein